MLVKRLESAFFINNKHFPAIDKMSSKKPIASLEACKEKKTAHSSIILLYSVIPISLLSKDFTQVLPVYWAFVVFPLIQVGFLETFSVLYGSSQICLWIYEVLTLYLNPVLYVAFGLIRNSPMALASVKLIILMQCLKFPMWKSKSVLFLIAANVISVAIEGWDQFSFYTFAIQFAVQLWAFCYLPCSPDKTEYPTQTGNVSCLSTSIQTEIKQSVETCSQVTDLFELASICTQTPNSTLEEKQMQTENTRTETEVQTDERDVYLEFFQSLKHPAFIIDLNVNVQAATPNIVNSPAKTLLRSNESLFENAHLEESNCSLSELLSTFRRRVEHPSLKTDRMKIKSGRIGVAMNSEAVYDVTVSTFDASNDLRMVGIIMMEAPKDREKEKLILEHFKTSLVCSLSHELFSPINSLILALNLLPSSTVEQKEDYKTMALANAELLSSKISDLIDYTTIELNDFKLQESEFYVETLFEELERILKYGGLQKKNKLIFQTLTCANRKLLIHADKRRIKQVLIKLITNANKYTEKGEISVTASEKADDLDVVFSVNDTGIGMTKEKVDQIFASLPEKAKFLHEHNDGSTKLPGLGLEIAKRICECMGGNLIATSTQKEGSVFSFEIPVCRIYTTPVLSSSLRRVSTTDSKNQMHGEVEEAKGRPMHSKQIFKQKTGDTQTIENLRPTINEPKRILKRRGSGTTLKPLREQKSMRIPHRMDFLSSHNIPHAQQQEAQLMSIAEKAESGDIPTEIEIGSENTDLYEKMQLYSRGRNNLRSTIHENMSVEDLAKKAINTEESKERASGCEKKHGVVLITDDDSFNRMALRGMLAKFHVKTLEAVNGKEAVDVVAKSIQKSSNYVVLMILMDLNMPEMDGVQATREIRKLEKLHKRVYKVPIVAVSAHNTEQDRVLCFKAGIQEFVPKPIQAKDVEKIVQTYVNTNIAFQQSQYYDLLYYQNNKMYQREKVDAYWIQFFLAICAITTYSACMYSFSALMSMISWEVFSALDIIELVCIVGKVILTVLYAILLILPLFLNLGKYKDLHETMVIVGGYFLGIMSLLAGFGFILAYMVTIVKIQYLVTFMVGLTEVVAGLSILVGKFMSDNMKAASIIR
eukprot:TRINITY_DN88676_c1_g1_i1.p1 TRINITY_DN88676_c1_g1~~TRINITY_DN88676_c1_g1_i1.p1  ORF type:complete len:1133 (+),score=124.53 TRINITY_DN88676_c1_g1_i1:84-3401(+)